MKAEDVTSILRCSECGPVWLPAEEERWRAYLDCDDEIQFFCVDCARREFETTASDPQRIHRRPTSALWAR